MKVVRVEYDQLKNYDMGKEILHKFSIQICKKQKNIRKKYQGDVIIDYEWIK